MQTILEVVLLAFGIGLTGALAPGPTLVATIQSSLRGGWTMGPKVTLGHMVLESVVFLLILAGISASALAYSSTIAIVGGGALVIFGIMTLGESRKAALSLTSGLTVGNPYLAGVVTGITNPYFWIWWLTVGSALVLQSLQGGLILALAFMGGHWLADGSWLTIVSTGIHRGRTVLTPGMYTWTLRVCGIFLILFGVYYLSTFTLINGTP